MLNNNKKDGGMMEENKDVQKGTQTNRGKKKRDVNH